MSPIKKIMYITLILLQTETWQQEINSKQTLSTSKFFQNTNNEISTQN